MREPVPQARIHGSPRSRAGSLPVPAALAVGLSLLLPRPAQAQAVDPRTALTAQALYDQASAEMDAKNHASACRKLEEVTRLVPEGIGAKLTLGECYEALGKLASAWSQYALVATLAARVGQPERAQRADLKAAALRPKLASLSIEVPPPVRALPGLAITRDGVLMGEAQWGVPLPVDAGGHEIVVTAAGYRPWKKQAEVVANGAHVVVKVPPLQAEEPAPQALAARPGVVAPLPPDRTWQRPVGLAAIAAGGVGLGAGAVLGGLALGRRASSDEGNHCDARNTCDATGLALRREAVGLGNGSTVAFVAGTAVLAGGVVLLLTAPAPASEAKPARGSSARPRARAQIAVTPGGLRFEGGW